MKNHRLLWIAWLFISFQCGWTWRGWLPGDGGSVTSVTGAVAMTLVLVDAWLARSGGKVKP